MTMSPGETEAYFKLSLNWVLLLPHHGQVNENENPVASWGKVVGIEVGILGHRDAGVPRVRCRGPLFGCRIRASEVGHRKAIEITRTDRKLLFDAPQGKGESVFERHIKIGFMGAILDR